MPSGTPLQGLLRNSRPWGGIFDPAGKSAEIERLERAASAPDFWNKPDKAQEITRKLSLLRERVERFRKLESRIRDLEAAVELIEEDEKLGTELLAESIPQLREVEKTLETLELEALLGAEEDILNAIVTIHPGAGGIESQDWAQMLLRMYTRWAERSGFYTEMLDIQYGEEAGIKSATFAVEGPYAYGYLKAETGVHRLVRISPYDASSRRHTSFASVFAYPEVEDEVEVEIEEKDLRIDTFRSSGAGGQHVNVTDSAVRITHLPTGVVVTCQNERSQHKNRATAMRILRARLYELKMKEKEEELAKIQGQKKEIAWGSQIRSYVLQPYRLVKDHRTGHEVGNVDAVLDGDIDDFMQAYLVGRRDE
ncbi:MAG: peptide chain release factor 2 [bacterium]|nr:MAG: peptide chain release factor 2 [bacterium]